MTFQWVSGVKGLGNNKKWFSNGSDSIKKPTYPGFTF